MPGVLNKKKESGITFPPDWREIGYSDTPESTLEGFDYAKEIDTNWDTSVHVYTEAFKDDYKLMYFPNMSYEKRYSMERCSRMFQNSNLEYFNSGLPYVQELASTFASCRNLRYCKITDLENTGINSINGLFTDCYQLEEVDINFDTLPASVTQMTNLFSGCWNFKKISISNPNIERADGAFQNTYMLNEANITLNKCYNISFYAAGKNSDKGCLFNVNIGSNANQGTFCTFENAKFNVEDDNNTRSIKIYNCDSIQSAFKGTNINIDYDLLVHSRSGNTVNCSYAFENVFFTNGHKEGYNTEYSPIMEINKIGNCNAMFKGTSGTVIDISKVDFTSATSFQNMFKDSTVSTILFNINNPQTCPLVTNMTDMFSGCNNLGNVSVNQILKFLSTATSYSGTKTLAALGFTSTYYPAADIQAMSNYSTFTAAGWSIGY